MDTNATEDKLMMDVDTESSCTTSATVDRTVESSNLSTTMTTSISINSDNGEEELFHDAHEFSFEITQEKTSSETEEEEEEEFKPANSSIHTTSDDDVMDTTELLKTEEDNTEDEDISNSNHNMEDDEDELDEDDNEVDDDEDEVDEVESSPPMDQDIPDSLRAFVQNDPVARQRLQAMLNGVAPQVKSIMEQLKQRTDPSLHLIALQNLSELLLVSTEDMLSGCLNVDKVAQELVFHLRGEDSICGGNPEIMLLACRCIANLVEAIPSSANTLVYREVVPVLCDKLKAIEYIDLAEQALSTLTPISIEYPGYILRNNGLSSVLMFLDFFTVNAQRAALNITANCCRVVRSDQWETVKELIPTLERLLDYSDQQVMESACLCFTQLVSGLAQHREYIEEIISSQILQRFNDILRSTPTAKLSDPRVSPSLAVNLLQLDIITLIYQWLTGTTPTGMNESTTTTLPLSSMVAEIADKPSDQLKNSLELLSQLLPPILTDTSLWHPSCLDSRDNTQTQKDKERQLILSEQLTDDECQKIGRWMLPVLVEVYTATSKVELRERIMFILLQLITMISSDRLFSVLKDVSVAGIVASTLKESKLSLLSLYTIQLTHLLLLKLPNPYAILFEREDIQPRIEMLKTIAQNEFKRRRRREEEENKEEENKEEEEEEEKETMNTNTNTEEISTTKNNDTITTKDVDHDLKEPIEDTEDKDTNMTPIDTTSTSRELVTTRLLERLGIRLSSLIEGTYRSVQDYAVLIAYKSTELIKLMEQQKMLSEKDIEQRSILQGQLKTWAQQLKELNGEALSPLAQALGASFSSISSIELVQSGVIEGLIHYLTSPLVKDGILSLKERQHQFVSLFYCSTTSSFTTSNDPLLLIELESKSTPLSILIKRLQEALGRHESLNIVGDHTSPFDDRSNLSNILNRQVRLRLVPDNEANIPKAYVNLIVSIHAAVPFQVLDDYLSSRLLEKMSESTVNKSSSNEGLDENEDESDKEEMEKLEEEEEEVEDLSDHSESIQLRNSQGQRIRRQSISSGLTSPTRTSTSSDQDRRHVTTSSKLIYQLEDRPLSYQILYIQLFMALYQVVTRSSWSRVYKVVYKKVSSNYQQEMTESGIEDQFKDLVEDTHTGVLLKLLKILHELNEQVDQGTYRNIDVSSLMKVEFINNQWTAKLRRQLDQPLVVISQLVPVKWKQVTKQFPFLFPFETRQLLWRLTSFGYARTLDYWLKMTRSTMDSANSNEQLFIGHIMKKNKVRLSREHILTSALELFASDKMQKNKEAMLEVEYVDEVGTGLGPTLEFYAQVSKELRHHRLELWRSLLDTTSNEHNSDSEEDTVYVWSPFGLFPRPREQNLDLQIMGYFRFMGQWVAQALMDSRLLDLPLSVVFIEKALGQPILHSLQTLAQIDPVMAQSLQLLQGYIKQKEELYQKEQTDQVKEEFKALQGTIEQLGLDFTLPGYPSIELKNEGREIDVTIYNIENYVKLVLDWTLDKGIAEQAAAFKKGFDSRFPMENLLCFKPSELPALLGEIAEDWRLEVIMEAIKADHGYTAESMAVNHLAEIMNEFDSKEQRLFLQFITGSPRLPVGGFKRLHPPLTVVRKLPESSLTSDDYLPSVMTCVNYLKLPNYSSKALLKQRLLQAIQEGQGSFHMS
ncbi:hypothetical protein BDF19DRAFT_418537 [Syncephalis fuscata]|nr:hypothetical protein BDF19DRAFT_418537 [Syncephalis fuscata]